MTDGTKTNAANVNLFVVVAAVVVAIDYCWRFARGVGELWKKDRGQARPAG